MTYNNNIKIINNIMHDIWVFDESDPKLFNNCSYNEINKIIDLFNQINSNNIETQTILLDNDYKKIINFNYQLHLFLIFLCKHNNISYTNNIILSYEDLIILTKYSVTFHSLQCFKEYFFKLDEKSQDYIIHHSFQEDYFIIFRYGYPLNIINYLIDIGYDNIINYNVILKDQNKYINFVNIFINDKYIQIVKDYCMNEMLLKIESKCKNFIKNLINAYNYICNKYSYIYHIETPTNNIYKIIKLFYNKNLKNNLIEYIGNNYNLIIAMWISCKKEQNLDTSSISLNNEIFKLALKKYKKIIINNKLYKLDKCNKLINNILNNLDDKIFITNIKWFNLNFIKFNKNVKKIILKKYNNLNLLDQFISYNQNNIINNANIYKYIQKINNKILIILDEQIINNFINESNYKFLEHYYYNNNINNNNTNLKKCIENNINILVKTNINRWRTRIKFFKALHFLKFIDKQSYETFLYENIKTINKKIYHDIFYNYIIKNNYINFKEENAYILFKSLLEYFKKHQIIRLLSKFPINITQIINIYSLIKPNYIRNNKLLIKLLQFKFKLSEEDISFYL